MASNGAPEHSGALDAVLVHSAPMPEGSVPVKGIDWNDYAGKDITVDDLVRNMSNMGFQASSLGKAVEIVDKMRSWRDPEDPTIRPTIFLGYTSNLISSGLRETIRYLVQHRHVSAIVTTAGGVEEDFIKCLAPTYMGAFHLDGATLRKSGMNRIGNLVVPNDNYCKFEDWVNPILDKMLEEQESSKSLPEEEHIHWTPSKIIHRLGKEINNEESVYYWAYKNDIPVFCPALTDGSLGDMLFFHTYKSSPAMLRIDIVEDIRRINKIALHAKCSGIIVLGGGVVKHHIANANLMRNGAEYAVFINTANEFDGSDAGARPDEAVSWGKIKIGGEAVKVYAEATLAFPLIVAATFAKGKGEAQAAPTSEWGKSQCLLLDINYLHMLNQVTRIQRWPAPPHSNSALQPPGTADGDPSGPRKSRGQEGRKRRSKSPAYRMHIYPVRTTLTAHTNIIYTHPNHLSSTDSRAKWASANTGHLRHESTEVSFLPRKRKPETSYKYWTDREIPGQPSPKRTATVEIAGVGSIMLLLQAILPYILYNGPKAGEDPTPLHLTVNGGTHVSKAPTLDYFTQVFVPTLKNLGYPGITVIEKRRGWSTGPTVPGEVEFVISSIPAGTSVPGFTMQEPGEIASYDITFIVPEEARRSFRETLNTWFEDRAAGVDMNIVKDAESGHPSRFYLLIVAKTRGGFLIGRDWIWDRKKGDVYKVAHDMVRKVWGWVQEEVDMGGCVDHYLQDQLVVYQVLADGESLVDGGGWGEGSLHAQTVRWVGSEVADVKWEAVGDDDDDDDEGEGEVDMSKVKYKCKGVGLISSTGEGWE
ncbi:hypothetical protein H072_8455 [Dactylellina haptotyla CBS 200.50]|uniref:deoxyhypusine synthase n=1 Tax=Dactylellina haptotyla (strain CBS 200.50) TaxID=1284197 RepID=S8BF31_DACHA|nr:hypothetical protein H072_8455 [Dactylellina haptotyla CBS 200.50]